MIRNILVTGSSGTIGTRLCEVLVKKGFSVTGVDKAPNSWSGEINNLTFISDLTKAGCFEKVKDKEFDLVIHLAANARVYDSVVNPDLAFENFVSTYNTLEFARKKKSCFMFASSREVYGNSEKTLHSESDVRLELCESPYSATKMAAEALVQAYHKCFGVGFVIFRFSNVYGMYDETDRVVPLFIRKCLAGDGLTVFGEEKMLDFTFIDDAIRGVVSAVERFDSVKNNVINISGAEPVRILDVAEIVKRLTNSSSKINIDNNRLGEVVKYTADLTKAKQLLGYSPKTPIEEGIKHAIKWHHLVSASPPLP